MEIIGLIVAGIIIGLLGKWVAPGDKDNIPIWLTVLCGIGGGLIGWVIFTPLRGHGRKRGGLGGWVVAGLFAGGPGGLAPPPPPAHPGGPPCAAVLVVIASTLTGRNRARTH